MKYSSKPHLSGSGRAVKVHVCEDQFDEAAGEKEQDEANLGDDSDEDYVVIVEDSSMRMQTQQFDERSKRNEMMV